MTKEGKKRLISIIVLLFLLLSIPLAILLVKRTTQFAPRAREDKRPSFEITK